MSPAELIVDSFAGGGGASLGIEGFADRFAAARGYTCKGGLVTDHRKDYEEGRLGEGPRSPARVAECSTCIAPGLCRTAHECVAGRP